MPSVLPSKFGRFSPVEGAFAVGLRTVQGASESPTGFYLYPPPLYKPPAATSNDESVEDTKAPTETMGLVGEKQITSKAQPSTVLRIVGILIAVAQPASAVLGMIGATMLVQQTRAIKGHGFPLVFSEENFDQGQTGMWWLAMALMVSAIEWLVAFVYVTLPKCAHATALAFPEHTNMDRIRQLGFALSDLLTAWSLFNIAGASPSRSDRNSHSIDNAFGIDESVLAQVLPAGSHNPAEIDLEHLASQLAFQTVRGSASSMDELLLVAAAMRLVVVFIQFVFSEGFNVCYILPFGRCGREYSGTNTTWTAADKKREQNIIVISGQNVYNDPMKENPAAKYNSGVIPRALMGYRGPCLKSYNNTNLKVNRCGCLAAFWHNHLGAVRNWLYFSCLLFFFGVLLQHRSVSGANNDYFWPQIWPDGTETLLAAVKEANVAAVLAAAEDRNTTTNTTHIESLIRASGVFPRSVEQLDPNVDKEGDATFWAFMAAGLMFAAEFFRFFSGLAYLCGIVRNQSSVPGNHIKGGGVSTHLCP